MVQATYQDLGNGIYCIDSEIDRIGLAACYLIQEGDAAAFVDTGTYHTVPYLLQVLQELDIPVENVQYVIPTHIHLDHAGGAGELMAHCPNATLITHPKGAPHMIDPAKLQAGAAAVYGEEVFAKTFGKLVPIPAKRVVAAEDGYAVEMNGRTLSFWDSPGHANHHGCILDHKTKSCFTGDTFGLSYREFDTDKGAWIVATSSPVAFDPDAWENTLDKLTALKPSAMLLTHYNRVTEVERLTDDLRNSVRDMKNIALSEEAQPDEGRKGRIEQKIVKAFFQQAKDHGCQLNDEEMHRLLDMDMDLNAQGLEVWLQRRARAAQR
uniref:Beta-lactamase related protein n=1 Tax=uncultured Thiotrichaceae bacterium TaxID=298394 RepID=A0A6S6UKR0_9GAMM|nr:MAG: Beta-lactamase related protein [uncultured Thiotrichaceae bacterium]